MTLENPIQNPIQTFKIHNIKIQQILTYKNTQTINNKKQYSINFYFELPNYPNPYSLDSYKIKI